MGRKRTLARVAGETSAEAAALASRPGAALAAALLVMFGLGAFYAWSVFVEPLERALGASRGEISLAYAAATVGFTLGMMAAPRLFGRVGAPALALAACAAAGSGLAIAGWASSAALVTLGFGGIFAVANGVGYGLALEVAQTALARRRGLASGLAVATYMAGSVAFAAAAAYGIERVGPGWTLSVIGAALAIAGIGAGRLLVLSRVALTVALPSGGGNPRAFLLLWCGFLCGSATGVMALGHAAAIVASMGGGARAGAAGAVLIALGSGAGRLAGGWMTDAITAPWVIAAAQLAGAVALLAVVLDPTTSTALVTLFMVGGAYGALVGAFPPAIGDIYGVERAAAVYGRVFTAWAVAGLGGSYLGGVLFDLTGTYTIALALAAASAALSALFALALRRYSSARSSKDGASV